MSKVRNWCGMIAGSLLLLNAAGAIADEFANYPCEAFGVEARYISLKDLRRLRSLRQEGPSSAAFLDLKQEDVAIIDEALRVGPSGGFFAARLLRDLVLIDAFEQQSQCDPEQACPKPEIIAGFAVDDRSSRGHGKSWQALIDDWRQFRDKDASRSRVCLDPARKLPTFDLPQIAMKGLKPGEQVGPGPRQETQPPAIPQANTALEPKRPEQADIDVVCRRQASNLLKDRQIHFAFGKSLVKSADRKFLADVAESIASCASLRVALVGHTDSVGPRRYNQRLSQRRADAVGRILRDAASVRLEISGLGESRPARPNTSRANKAYNRRVTIEVL